MDLRKIHEIFVEEATEHLEVLGNGLVRLEQEPGDAELLNAIFRSAHTIKGSSGTVGLPDISCFTHVMEEIMESLRAGTRVPDREMISTLLEGVDVIKEMVEGVAAENPYPFDQCRPVMERMDLLREGARYSHRHVSRCQVNADCHADDPSHYGK